MVIPCRIRENDTERNMTQIGLTLHGMKCAKGKPYVIPLVNPYRAKGNHWSFWASEASHKVCQGEARILPEQGETSILHVGLTM